MRGKKYVMLSIVVFIIAAVALVTILKNNQKGEHGLKWADSKTWASHADLILDTPEKWTKLEKIPDGLGDCRRGREWVGFEWCDSEIMAPNLKPGEHAAITTDKSFVLVLPDDAREQIKIIFANISKMESGELSASGGEGSYVKHVIWPAPRHGRNQKIVLYRMTEEEFKTKKY